MTSSQPRRCAAERTGTALLILFGVRAVVGALPVGEPVDYAALGVIGVSFALAVAIVIACFGTTSGAPSGRTGLIIGSSATSLVGVFGPADRSGGFGPRGGPRRRRQPVRKDPRGDIIGRQD